jgi:hypothetical protein
MDGWDKKIPPKKVGFGSNADAIKKTLNNEYSMYSKPGKGRRKFRV